MEEYNKIFDQLWQHAESEIVEFKKAESNFDFDELGRYFSALSNEANLRERDFAWLVFGVHDKTHTIVGTSYKDGEVALKIDNDKRSVGVTIYGKVIDENYTNLLKSDTFLSLPSLNPSLRKKVEEELLASKTLDNKADQSLR